MQLVESTNSSEQLKRIFYSSGFITLLFLVIKSLGFFEKLILAKYFGTGDAADAFLFAFSVPFSLFIVFEEILGPVLVPFLVQKNEQGNPFWALKVFRQIALYCFSLLILISVLGIWHSDWIVSHLAPGFTGEKQALTIQLCRGLFVILIFLGINSLITIIYHAHKKFNLPVWARALEKFVIISGILLLNSRYGIYSAVVGCIIGSILRVVLLIWRLPISSKDLLVHVQSEKNQTELRTLLFLMFPLLCGVLFSQMSSIVDNFVASKLASGSISALSYARKIVDLPVLMVPFAIGIVLLPYFSSLVSPEKREQFTDIFERCFKILFILFVYITIVVIVFSSPIVKLLFERGKFDTSSSRMTSVALSWFAFGLVPFAIEIPVMQAFFALKDTRTPIWIGIFCVLINIALTLSLVNYIGYIAVPLALSFQKWLKVSILISFLRKKLPIQINRLLGFSIRAILCGVLSALLVLLIKKIFVPVGNTSVGFLVIFLILGSAITFVVFFIFGLVFKISQFYQSIEFLKRMTFKLVKS